MKLKNFFVAAAVIVASYTVCTAPSAKVNFLPGSSGSRSAGRAIQGNPCTGYNLRSKKCEDEACKPGWNCDSCTNARGTFYKCTPRSCEGDFKAGTMSCATCQEYTYKGFSGNRICGKCTQISNCTSSGSQSFTYTNGVSIKGKNINKIEKTGYRL